MYSISYLFSPHAFVLNVFYVVGLLLLLYYFCSLFLNDIYMYHRIYIRIYVYGEKGEKDVGRTYVEKRMKNRTRERLPLHYTSCVFSAPWKSTATIIRPDCCVYDNFSGNIENETPCAAAGEMLFYIIVSRLFAENISFIFPCRHCCFGDRIEIR
jgi:hypothetical protein